LEAAAEMAKKAFRDERPLEPLDLYNQFFATFSDIFRQLIDKLPNVVAELFDARWQHCPADLAAFIKKVN